MTSILATELPNGYENKLLTPARRAILSYLYEHKFGTTKQINEELQPGKVVNHTLGDLNRLRQMNMVRSFPCHISQGGRSMLCWLIKREGATAIGKVWGSQFDREPSDQQILMRDWEINIEVYANWGEWELMKPVTFSPAQPAPDPKKGERTAQAKILEQAVKCAAYQEITDLQIRDPHSPFLQDKIRQHNAGLNEVGVPAKANEYLAWHKYEVKNGNGSSLNFTQAMVLILASPDATTRFWAKRIEEYKRIASLIPIVAVFATENQALASRDYIKKGGLKVTTLSKLFDVLESYWIKGQT